MFSISLRCPRLVIALSVAFGLATRGHAETPASPAASTELAAATGQRAVRLVWSESPAADPLGTSTRQVLRGWDSVRGTTLQSISSTSGNYSRPLLSSDGRSIYYTDRRASTDSSGTKEYDPEIFTIPFTGGTPQSLGRGFAVAVRQDAGQDWIYALSTLRSSKRELLSGDRLVKFTRDKPGDREIVWSASELGVDCQVSRDGTQASGLFPWPQAGRADLATHTLSMTGHGTTPTLAPDDSYAQALLDGTRKRLRFFIPQVEPGWEVDCAALPEMAASPLNHPRWSNDPCFMTWTGPYPQETARGGVWAIQFRPDLRSVEHVIRITPADYTSAALYPDMWVEGGAGRQSALVQQPSTTAVKPLTNWPQDPQGLHFSWEHSRRTGTPLTLHSAARPGYHGALLLDGGGWAAAPADTAAAFSSASRDSAAWSLELALTEERFSLPLSIRLFSIRGTGGEDILSLYRVGHQLVLRQTLGAAAVVTPTVIATVRPDHLQTILLTLTYQRGTLTYYLNGQAMRALKLTPPELTAWKAASLIIGDPQPYGEPWKGSIERIALYSRALPAEDIRTTALAAQERFSLRRLPATSNVRARLISSPALPTNTSQPTLHASLWEIESTTAGPDLATPRITLLQWAALGGTATPLPSLQPGAIRTFPVTAMEDHPELDTATVHNTLTEQAPLYLDMTTPGHHAPPTAP